MLDGFEAEETMPLHRKKPADNRDFLIKLLFGVCAVLSVTLIFATTMLASRREKAEIPKQRTARPQIGQPDQDAIAATEAVLFDRLETCSPPIVFNFVREAEDIGLRQFKSEGSEVLMALTEDAEGQLSRVMIMVPEKHLDREMSFYREPEKTMLKLVTIYQVACYVCDQSLLQFTDRIPDDIKTQLSGKREGVVLTGNAFEVVARFVKNNKVNFIKIEFTRR